MASRGLPSSSSRCRTASSPIYFFFHHALLLVLVIQVSVSFLPQPFGAAEGLHLRRSITGRPPRRQPLRNASSSSARSFSSAAQEPRWRAVVLNLERRKDRLEHFAEALTNSSSAAGLLKQKVCRLAGPDGSKQLPDPYVAQLLNANSSESASGVVGLAGAAKRTPFEEELLKSGRIAVETLNLAMAGQHKEHGGLTSGAIGCYLAHWEAWQLLLESPEDELDYLLVLEDDADWYAPDFEARVKQALQPSPEGEEEAEQEDDEAVRRPLGRDFVYLQSCQDDQGVRWNWEGEMTTPNSSTPEKLRQVRDGHLVVCSAAYLVSRKGARRLSEKAFPMQGQLDFMLQSWGVKRWLFTPPIVQVSQAQDPHDSDVQWGGAISRFYEAEKVWRSSLGDGGAPATTTTPAPASWLPPDCERPKAAPAAWWEKSQEDAGNNGASFHHRKRQRRRHSTRRDFFFQASAGKARTKKVRLGTVGSGGSSVSHGHGGMGSVAARTTKKSAGPFLGIPGSWDGGKTEYGALSKEIRGYLDALSRWVNGPPAPHEVVDAAELLAPRLQEAAARDKASRRHHLPPGGAKALQTPGAEEEQEDDFELLASRLGELRRRVRRWIEGHGTDAERPKIQALRKEAQEIEARLERTEGWREREKKEEKKAEEEEESLKKAAWMVDMVAGR